MDKDKKINTSLPVTIDYSSMTPISSLISKFTVRILYLGKNRNGSYFTKEVVDKMVEGIGGIPVIGHYDAEKGDFLAHGDLRVEVIDDEVQTKNVGPVPYGFIPNNPRVWWEKHNDKDNTEREYLCTEAYLWTGRYPELEILKDGKSNQSMELNPDTIDGDWSEVEGGDFYFVIKSADFFGLCILGKEVEPCFEGAGFAPNFSLNTDFVQLISTMKEELKTALTDYSATSHESEIEEEEEEEDYLDNLEGPTVEELLKIEKELKAEKERNEHLEEKYELLEEELRDTKEKLDIYIKKEEKNNKENILEMYQEDLTKEQYDNFNNKLEDYSLKDLETEIQKVAYKNLKTLRLKQNNEGVSLYTNSYTDDQGHEDFLEVDDWMKAVYETQKKI